MKPSNDLIFTLTGLIILTLRVECVDVEKTTFKTDNVKNVSGSVRRIENIRKSDRDSRSYRALILGNGLKVMLISDEDTEKSAVSMAIDLGADNDSDQIPGLAHLLEHMLFKGLQEHQEEDYFENFINTHGGSHNGVTEEGLQYYYWDILNEFLAPALEIFVQFFIRPVIDESFIDKEIVAVDSEHRRNSEEDFWRLSRLEAYLSKSDHPHSRFRSGNLKSLQTVSRSTIREKLLEFFSSHYSSNTMHLVVLGKEKLDDLERMVIPLFEQIENRKLSKTEYNEHPWGPNELKKMVCVLPESGDLRLLRIRFPTQDIVTEHYKASEVRNIRWDLKRIPNDQQKDAVIEWLARERVAHSITNDEKRDAEKDKPVTYIKNLMENEAPGSLSSALGKKYWCEVLTISDDHIPGFGFFNIDIYLTKEGLSHISEIIVLVFEYTNFLKTEGIQFWYHQEMKKSSAMEFLFKEKEYPQFYVTSISVAMTRIPFQDVLIVNYLRDEWKPGIIRDFLKHLTPDNMNIFIVSDSFKELVDLTEPWYEIKYSADEITEDVLQDWRATESSTEFYLPQPNEFISEKCDIYPADDDKSTNPYLILDSSFSQIWFKQDDKFKIPKLSIQFDLYSPITCGSPINYTLNEIFVDLLNESLLKYMYAAKLAGLRWFIKAKHCRIYIGMYGYDEKLPLLLEKVILEMINFQVDEKKFEIAKNSQILACEFFKRKQLSKQANFYIDYILQDSFWTVEEYLSAAKIVQVNDFKEFVSRLFSRIFINGLIYGNCNKQKAVDIANSIESSIRPTNKVLPQELISTRLLKMDSGSTITYGIFSDGKKDSFYYSYFQIGIDRSLFNSVRLGLFVQIVRLKCVKFLRTKEEMGYVVECDLLLLHGVLGFIITIQSDKQPSYIDSKVEEMLESLKKMLENMTEGSLEEHKITMRSEYLEELSTQMSQGARYWREISYRRYSFDRYSKMAAIVDDLKVSDIINLFMEFLHKSAEKRAKLTLNITSKEVNSTLRTDVDATIGEITALKNGFALFPAQQSYMLIAPLGVKSHSSTYAE